MSDLIKTPPDTDKYLRLKEQLISRFSETKEKQIHKLLTGLVLDDKKPSQLLREMRTLANQEVNEEILRTIWMKRMLEMINCVLSASDGVELDKLVEIAEKIIEHQTIPLILATSTQIAATSSQSGNTNSMLSRLSALEKAMSEMAVSVKRLHKILAFQITKLIEWQ